MEEGGRYNTYLNPYSNNGNNASGSGGSSSGIGLSGASGGPIRRGHRDPRSRRNNDPYGLHQRHGHGRMDPRDEEKPCRTLFVRNIQFDTTPEEIWNVFGPYGDIKEIYNKVETRGLAFVHYYDLRSAERAKADCDNIKIKDRNLDIHYSLPKDDLRVIKCDETKNQGTLLLSLNGSQSSLVDSELYEYFKKFGDVKVIRTPAFKTYTENTERWQRLVEFYDSRDAVRAATATHKQSYKNGIWDVTYFWDQPPRQRDTSPSHRADRFRRQDTRHHRERNDYRQDRERTDHHQHHYPSPSSAPPPPHSIQSESSNMTNAQKAQQLLALLAQLQNVQNTAQQQPLQQQPQSSGYTVPNLAQQQPQLSQPSGYTVPSFTQQQQSQPSGYTGTSTIPSQQQQLPLGQGQNQIQQLMGLLSQATGVTLPAHGNQNQPQPQPMVQQNYHPQYSPQHLNQPQNQQQQPYLNHPTSPHKNTGHPPYNP
ncbi:uncharacterized protein BX664DRAFT_340098 [Halteromyces radiatus]|uniref:uncharacterized protein n=1 Tax=Halteromyces radiatus TaxID=101107 RepID=UPI00221E8277|nr:uncharacterized protein BX664DRAFT_340098 [Halteromyces radiatus]KAI8081310.1 hypothetical protein BX664DRAFT_340098 [Halteromyces radiatus]